MLNLLLMLGSIAVANFEPLDTELPPALGAFFKAHDDLDQDAIEDCAKRDLSNMFLRFKKNFVAHESQFKQMVKQGVVAAKDAAHFKSIPKMRSSISALRRVKMSVLQIKSRR